MISSRWPRLVGGTIASIGLLPVIIDWFTERRGRIPGAFREGGVADQKTRILRNKIQLCLMGL